MGQLPPAPQGQRVDAYKALAACYCAPDETFPRTLEALVGQDETLAQLLQAAVSEDIEALEVDHARLFVGPYKLLAPPYGSVYLENSALMGESTMDAAELYHQEGLEAVANQVPDHITAELEFMHVLILKEAQTAGAGDIPGQAHYRERQKSFLSRHLGTWVADFAEKIAHHAQTEYYRALARVTKRFVLDDLDQLCRDEAVSRV